MGLGGFGRGQSLGDLFGGDLQLEGPNAAHIFQGRILGHPAHLLGLQGGAQGLAGISKARVGQGDIIKDDRIGIEGVGPLQIGDSKREILVKLGLDPLLVIRLGELFVGGFLFGKGAAGGDGREEERGQEDRNQGSGLSCWPRDAHAITLYHQVHGGRKR